MALSAAQLLLVEALGKETQDFARAAVISMFLIKYGTLSAIVGDITVSFTSGTDVTRDDPYADTGYIINILEALDSDGVDVRGELEITNKTVNGFTINSTTACTIKWQTSRQAPLIDFYT